LYLKQISLFIGILIYTSKVLKTNRTFKLKLSHPPAAHLGALLPVISSAPCTTRSSQIKKQTQTNNKVS